MAKKSYPLLLVIWNALIDYVCLKHADKPKFRGVYMRNPPRNMYIHRPHSLLPVRSLWRAFSEQQSLFRP